MMTGLSAKDYKFWLVLSLNCLLLPTVSNSGLAVAVTTLPESSATTDTSSVSLEPEQLSEPSTNSSFAPATTVPLASIEVPLTAQPQFSQPLATSTTSIAKSIPVNTEVSSDLTSNVSSDMTGDISDESVVAQNVSTSQDFTAKNPPLADLLLPDFVEIAATARPTSSSSMPTSIEQDQGALLEVNQIAQNAPLSNPSLENLLLPNLPENGNISRGRVGHPGSSISSPSGFGAQAGSAYTSVGYQAQTRGVPGPNTSGKSDGGFGFGFGLGNPRQGVGLELGVTSVSTFRRTPFQGGTVSVKMHRLLGETTSVALGVENLIRWGVNDGGSSLYGVVSHKFTLADDPDAYFSALSLSLGVGNGRFRSLDDIRNDRSSFNVFGSVGLRVAPPVSVVADWSGQDLGLGLSAAPFYNLPLTINASVVDITGNANSDARFVFGIGYGFNF